MPRSFQPPKEPISDKKTLRPDLRKMYFDDKDGRWYQGPPLAQVVAQRAQYDSTFFLLHGAGIVMLCIGLVIQERNFIACGSVAILGNIALRKLGFFSNDRKPVYEDANTAAYDCKPNNN